VMGLGIAAMHYIAMAGVTFRQTDMPVSLTSTIRVNVLGEGGISLVAALVLLGALVTAALDQRRLEGLTLAHGELEEAQQSLLRSENELREANLLLNELVLRDGLTGIHNRRQLDAVLAVEWRRAARDKQPIALLMIDVDHFKAYNDCYGHMGGDEFLCDVARVLSEQPRRGHDCVARFGGEEFAVVLTGSGEADALTIAESMRAAVEALRREHLGSTTSPHVTVSVGVASLRPAVGQTLTELLAEADAALYVAKESGRNCVIGASGAALQPMRDKREASVTS
jgi:diguanylate cyclase (GGDEF)-like protein